MADPGNRRAARMLDSLQARYLYRPRAAALPRMESRRLAAGRLPAAPTITTAELPGADLPLVLPQETSCRAATPKVESGSHRPTTPA